MGFECGAMALEQNQGQLLSVKEEFKIFRAFYI